MSSRPSDHRNRDRRSHSPQERRSRDYDKDGRHLNKNHPKDPFSPSPSLGHRTNISSSSPIYRSSRDSDRDRPRDRHDRDRPRERSQDRDRRRGDNDRSRSSRDYDDRRDRDRHRSERDEHSRRDRDEQRRKDDRSAPSSAGKDQLSAKSQVVPEPVQKDDIQVDNDEADAQDETPDDADLMAAMGFSGFASTANQHVAGNGEIGAVNIVKQRKYRQYMNRKGGFNRNLDKME